MMDELMLSIIASQAMLVLSHERITTGLLAKQTQITAIQAELPHLWSSFVNEVRISFEQVVWHTVCLVFYRTLSAVLTLLRAE
jgi:hypothetical protein